MLKEQLKIISYQVITGNYNETSTEFEPDTIISYQVITGNYNGFVNIEKVG